MSIVQLFVDNATGKLYAANAQGNLVLVATGQGPGVTNITPKTISGIPLSLGASGVTAGSYTNTNLTVGADGRITLASNGTGGGGGVSSVGLALPATVFSITGSPVTTSGTLTGSFSNQAANMVFAGPASGASTTPAFRAIVPADVPTFVASGTGHASGAVPDPGATAGTTRYLREDATWHAPSASGLQRFRVHLGTNQSVAANTYTIAPFDTIDIDTGSYFNTTTHQFVPAAGTWLLGTHVGFVGNGNTQCFITKNASLPPTPGILSNSTYDNGDGTNSKQLAMDIVVANGTDFFQVVVAGSLGIGTLNGTSADTYFWGTQLA